MGGQTTYDAVHVVVVGDGVALVYRGATTKGCHI